MAPTTFNLICKFCRLEDRKFYYKFKNLFYCKNNIHTCAVHVKELVSKRLICEISIICDARSLPPIYTITPLDNIVAEYEDRGVGALGSKLIDHDNSTALKIIMSLKKFVAVAPNE